MVSISLDELLSTYCPGSNDWTWDDEAAYLLSFGCGCHNAPDYAGPTPCPIAGHYQLNLEAHLRTVGRITQGVCLGNDGRIWDGHHRIVAARRLGFTEIPIED